MSKGDLEKREHLLKPQGEEHRANPDRPTHPENDRVVEQEAEDTPGHAAEANERDNEGDPQRPFVHDADRNTDPCEEGDEGCD